jgi:hypothetical protein
MSLRSAARALSPCGFLARERHESTDVAQHIPSDAGIVRASLPTLLTLGALSAPMSLAQTPSAPTWPAIGAMQTTPCSQTAGVAGNRAGGTLAVLSDCSASPNGRVVIAMRPPDGELARAAEIPGRLIALAPQGDGGVLAGVGTASNRGFAVADVSTAGRVEHVAQLTRRFVSPVDIAANDRGQAIAAWVPTARPSVQVRIRARRGEAFGPPVNVVNPGQQVSGLSVAIGRDGALAVLWASPREGHRSVFARLGRVGTRALGPPIRVGANDRVASIDAAFSAAGVLTVIWRTADAGIEQNRPAVVRAATLPRGARRFRTHRLGVGVDDLHLRFGPGVRVMAAGTDAVLAWTGVDHVVRLASVSRTGDIGPAELLERDALLGDLAGSPEARVLITWLRHPYAGSANEQLVASIRFPIGRLTAPEPIGPLGSLPAAAAIDPTSARAAVASMSDGVTPVSTFTIFQRQIDLPSGRPPPERRWRRSAQASSSVSRASS